jgi:sec-independent protein translocase protein TatA
MIPAGLFGSFGIQELLVVLLLVVFLFGARRIPEIARGLGEGIRGFRTALRGSAAPDDQERGEDARKGPSEER